MSRAVCVFMHGVAALAAGLFVIQIGAQRTAVVAPALLTVDYPPDGAVFPPEITPPTFMWRDAAGAGGEPAGAWAIAVDFADGSAPILRQVRGERMSIPAIDPRAVSATNRPPAPTPGRLSGGKSAATEPPPPPPPRARYRRRPAPPRRRRNRPPRGPGCRM